MFWSKIWFFVVAALGAVAFTAAFVVPQPAARKQQDEEVKRVKVGCDVVNILLHTHARRRIDLAGQYARAEIDVSAILGPASGKKEVSADSNKTARPAAEDLMENTDESIRPRFTMLLDNRGRVVARVGMSDQLYGDSLAGYALVDDALNGYLRDDIWLIDKNLYLMSASPVISNNYVGAVVLGHAMDKKLAERFARGRDVQLSFYAGGEVVAATDSASIHKQALAELDSLRESEGDIAGDCRSSEPFTVELGDKSYIALLARLPGEAGTYRDAFFAVYVERLPPLGLLGTIKSASSSDLSFDNFPWLLLALGFIVAVGVGMALMVLEADRPLRKLNAEAIVLAKGARDRFDEGHRGKYGSVARSVNIRIDKMERDARESASKNNLDDLLGPAPAGPMVGSSPHIPVPAAKPPPPSQFRFSDSDPRVPALPPRPAAPAPSPSSSGPDISISNSTSGITTPPPFPVLQQPAPEKKPSLIANGSGEDDDVFRKVFDQFLVVKNQCGESIANLTFERFAKKLRTNRDALMAKHSCKEVRFQVYVKDGKAALKATPIKTS